jgi:hypothetical protein
MTSRGRNPVALREEQRLKKIHDQKIKGAKPTMKTRPSRKKKSGQCRGVLAKQLENSITGVSCANSRHVRVLILGCAPPARHPFPPPYLTCCCSRTGHSSAGPSRLGPELRTTVDGFGIVTGAVRRHHS